MDHVSILRALVQLEGVPKAASELAALDAAQKGVAASATSMGGDVDTATAKVRAMQADVAKATAAASGLGDGMRHAGSESAATGAKLDETAKATGKTTAALGDAAKATDLWRDAQGRLRTSSGRFATDAEKIAAGLDGIGQRSRGLGGPLATVSNGFSEATLTVARAREEFDRTGTVSRSTMRDLNQLGSRGVQGIDRDLAKASGTIRKAQDELASTGTISRRTARDLEQLGASGDGAGNGIRGLVAALGAGGGGLSFFGVTALGVVPVMVALAGAAFALVSALGPLVGLAAAAGVALAAAGQGFGVFKLATMGVGDALKEQTSQQASAGSAAVNQASQQRAAARQIQSALEGVRSAHEQVRSATERLTAAEEQAGTVQASLTVARTEASRALVDMRSSLEDARVAEAQATFALQDARAALDDLRAGASQQELVEGAQRALDVLHNQQAAVLALTDAQAAYDALINGPDAQTIAEATQAVTSAQHDQESAAIALTKAQQDYDAVMADAAATDLQKAEALSRLHQAQDGVATSANRTISAQEALDKLNAGPTDNEKAKALLAVQQAQDSVAGATNGAAAAQDALDKLKAPASQHELAKAMLAVIAAQDNVAKATRDRLRQEKDTAAAVRAGVDGSPQVVAAHRAIEQANRQVVDAERALTDAHHSVTKAQQAVRDAQLNAADSADKAAIAAGKLNEKMNGLPAPAQAFVRQLIAMKPKLDELRETAAAGLFPGVSAGLTAALGSFEPVKKVIGDTGTALGDLARKAGEMVGSPAWGKDIETVGGRNAKIIGTVGDGALHAANALRHVIVAAGPLTSWLARTADGWGKTAEESARAGRENGKLAGFFERTRGVLERLGSIVKHTVGGLLGIGHAARKSGDDMLESIDRAAKRFDRWTHSVDGQKSLSKFFEDSKELLKDLVPALEGVGKATATIGFGPMATALKIAGPHAEQLTYAFLAWKSMGAVAGIIAGIATAMEALDVAMAANPIVLAAVAIAALVVGLIIAYEKIGWFHDAVDKVFGWIKDHWPLLLGILTGPFGLAVVEIIKHWGQITDFFRDLPGKIVDLIKATPKALGDAGSWVLDQIVAGFEAVTDLLSGVGSWLLDQYVSLVKSEIDGVKAVGSWLLDRIVDGFKAVTSLLSTVGSWVKDKVVGLIHAEAEGLKTVGTWVLHRIVDGYKTVTDALSSAGSWIKSKISGFIHAEADAIKAIGTWVLNKAIDGFTTVTDALSGAGAWLFRKLKGVVHDTAEDLKGLGSWVIDKVVDGFTFVSDKGVSGVSSVGGWIFRQLKSLVHDLKDDFVGLGGWIVDKIVDGLKGGANLFVDFLNKIIGAINHIPGVDIGKIKKLAQGGTTAAASSVEVAAFATGGEIARSTLVPGSALAAGGLVDKPIIMMGEEAPSMPEWVIPTNPAYRQRAVMLHEQAGKAIGLAKGGVFSSTAYGPPWTGINGSGTTATGVDLHQAPHVLGVAVDPNVIPLGTMMKIRPNPFGTDQAFKAFDTGSAIQGRRLDFYDWIGRQHQMAWGRRDVNVDIPDGGGGGILHSITGAVSDVGSAVGGAIGGLASKGASAILDKLPGVGDLPDWLKGTGKYVLSHVTDWIKDKVSDLVPGGSGPGPAGGPSGVGSFRGVPMAEWVVQALQHAERKLHTVLHPSSGWRSQAEQDAIRAADPRAATVSEHLGVQYPHGAVDFGGFTNPAAYAIKMAVVNATKDFKWPLLAPIGFRDDGHASGTGHAIGGILGKAGGMYGGLPFGGSFADGGVVPGPLGAPTAIIAHGGETVTPVGGGVLEATIRALGDEIRGLKDSLGVRVYLGEEDITDRVEVVMDRRDREAAQQFRAGVGR